MKSWTISQLTGVVMFTPTPADKLACTVSTSPVWQASQKSRHWRQQIGMYWDITQLTHTFTKWQHTNMYLLELCTLHIYVETPASSTIQMYSYNTDMSEYGVIWGTGRACSMEEQQGNNDLGNAQSMSEACSLGLHKTVLCFIVTSRANLPLRDVQALENDVIVQ